MYDGYAIAELAALRNLGASTVRIGILFRAPLKGCIG